MVSRVSRVSRVGIALLPRSASTLTAHCSLLTAHYSLLTAHCSLLTPHSSILTPHHSLPSTHYPLHYPSPHSGCYLLLLTPHLSPPTTQHPLPRLTVAAARAEDGGRAGPQGGGARPRPRPRAAAAHAVRRPAAHGLTRTGARHAYCVHGTWYMDMDMDMVDR